jgi:hypothetical protein
MHKRKWAEARSIRRLKVEIPVIFGLERRLSLRGQRHLGLLSIKNLFARLSSPHPDSLPKGEGVCLAVGRQSQGHSLYHEPAGTALSFWESVGVRGIWALKTRL